MDQETPETPLDLGIYGRPVRNRVDVADIVASVLSVVWVAIIAAFWLITGINTEAGTPGFNPVTFVMTMVSILLPIGLIWVASTSAKTARIMREEAKHLQSSIDAMRHAYVTQQQTSGLSVKSALEKQIGEIAASQKQTQSAIATFASRREGSAGSETPSATKAALGKKVKADDVEQPSLALGTPASDLVEPISIAEFIRAINFPENESDSEGFRTLRHALSDREIARMVRASQDVLTLLSQDGIYMDDLRPDRPRAETWRRFAKGERGPAVAGLGGIRDRSCLALTSGRMKKDPVFRDAVHHFLRQFDQILTEFEHNATDEELIAMGETRTTRAFMLLGRVTGTFD